MFGLSLSEQFAFILFIHFLYDFHIQGDFVAYKKTESFGILLVHSFTWAIFIALTLNIFGVYSTWKFVFLFLTHTIMDTVKVALTVTTNYYRMLYIDQAVHIATLIVVFIF